MSITDELRAGGIYRSPSNRRVFTEEELTAIADRIDAEVEQLREREYQNGREDEQLREREYQNGREDAGGAVEFADRLCRASERREDVTLWGVDYMPLPVDADGVPIHVGDWITGDWDAKAKVVAITSEDVYWWEPDGCHWCHAYEVRHHRAPTVEDVLREFGDWYAHAKCGCDEDGIVAEYAAKLRLAGDE